MANQRCTVCNKADATSCSVCKSTAYCSKACEAKNERIHKLLCEKYVEFVTNETRPINSAKLALHFPISAYGQKGELVKLVWLDTKTGEIVAKDPNTGKTISTDVMQEENVTVCQQTHLSSGLQILLI